MNLDVNCFDEFTSKCKRDASLGALTYLEDRYMFKQTRFYASAATRRYRLVARLLACVSLTNASAYADAAENTAQVATFSASLAIDDGLFVDINGLEQWITIRGSSQANPVLLILHGGPGIAMSGMAPLFADWEKNYTIIQWDQPGGGATYAKNIAAGASDLSMERITSDGLAVTEFVLRRLGAKKAILFGVSWGTSVGLNMIKRRPELFSAYVGTGQMVDHVRADELSYQHAIDSARARNDKAAMDELEGIGPPPYKSLEAWVLKQKHAMAGPAEQAAISAIVKALSIPPSIDARYLAKGLPAYNGEAVFLAAQKTLFEDPAKFDARKLGLRFQVPLFFFQGEHDINTVTSLVTQYFTGLSAPTKKLVILKGAGHNTLGVHEELLLLLDTHVRPITLNMR